MGQLRREHGAVICLVWGMSITAAAAGADAMQDTNAAQCPPPSAEATESSYVTVRHQAMGTELVVLLYPPSPDMYTEEVRYITGRAFDAIDGLERRISIWLPQSYTARLNARAAQEPVETSQELLQLLVDAKRIHRDTAGAFDVTVGPLLKLWGFYKKQGHLPGGEELKGALEKVGLDRVKLDLPAGTVQFEREGMRLDFGGIGKGLALDYAAEVLRQQGVKSALLHAGTSTVVAMGAPPGEPGWTVRIRSPYNKTRAYLDEVRISDESLSTSSGAERFFEIEGKKYCHIFDPRTGKPVEGVLSATAIAPTGLESDALSTAFFVMGKEETEAYCKARPETRAIVVILEDGEPKPVRINFAGPSGEERQK